MPRTTFGEITGLTYIYQSCVMLHDPDNAESPIRVMELVSLITASWSRAAGDGSARVKE